MFEKIIDQKNRNRPEGTKPLSKSDIFNRLRDKGLVKASGYEYFVSMANKIDRKTQDRISIPILKELSNIFEMTIDEILSNY